MGEAAGKIYVAKHFPPEAKARMKELVANLIAAYREEIASLEWMSPETRKRALEKLARFNPKIGYPDKWRDYTAPGDPPRRPGGQRAAGDGLRGGPPPRQARQAGRPRRVGHDAPDRQRLLQSQHERDRLPGGDLATPVLRHGGRRRGELRRHRRGHRPRDRPWLRRPGLEVRRRGQHDQLVDRPRPQGV